jgi:Ca-activated chloride channel family protein
MNVTLTGRFRACLLSLTVPSVFIVSLAGTPAQGPTPSPRTPQSVQLSLIVTDQTNHAVDEVQKEKIQVVDEGIPQTVSALTKDERPTNYALVIDNSGSFRDVLDRAIGAAKLIIEANRNGDEAFIERFISSDKIETVQEFTSDGNLLIKGLDTLYVEKGQSAVIDALYLAIDHTAKYRAADTGRRRAVVIFTDCEERASYYSNKQLIKLVRENNVEVFVVGIIYLLNKSRGLFTGSPQEKAENLAKRFAEESGGRAFFPKDGDQLIDVTKQIIHDLRRHFIIGYECQGKPSDKSFRKVKVTINGPEQLNAIVRSGYSTNPQIPIQKENAGKSP